MKLQDAGRRIGILERMPELDDDLWFIWHGFQTLNARRQDGNALTLESVTSWLDLVGINDRSSRWYVARLMFEMDEAVCERMRKELEQQRAKSTGGNKRGRR